MDHQKDSLLCPNCKEVYDEPYVMSCGDSICLSCINKLKCEVGEGQNFKCPQCQDSITGFKVQGNLKKIVDSYKEDQLKERHKCLTHTHIRLSLYCETCHIPICSECAKTLPHNEHKLIDINKEQFIKYHHDLLHIRSDIEGASNMKSNQMVILKSEFKSIQECFDSQMVEIDFVFKSVREFLDSRESELKRQLKSYHETNQELFDKNIESLDEQSKTLLKTIEDINSNNYLQLDSETLFKDHKYFVVLQNHQASKLLDLVQTSKNASLEYVKFRTAELRYHSQNTIQDKVNKMIRLSQISILNNKGSNNAINTSALTVQASSPSLKPIEKKKSGFFSSNSDKKESKRNSVSNLSPQNSTPSMTELGRQISFSYGFDDDFSDDDSDITLGSNTSGVGNSSDELPLEMNHPSFFEPQVEKIQIKTIALVYNPFSGSKIGEKIMNQAKKFFEENNIKVTVIPTEYKNHAEDICKTIDVTNLDVVCMIGGDGTIHEAVNGIMKRDVDSRNKFVLACLPAGTGNSFVLELQGKLNIKFICRRILKGLTTPIDIARVTSLTKDKINAQCAVRSEQFNAIKDKYGSLMNVDKNMLTQSQTAGTAFLEEAKKGVRPDTMMEFGHAQFPTDVEDHEIHPDVIYSFNSLHWGLGSRINIRAEKLRWMGKAVRYTTAALLEMFKGEKILARVEYEEADGTTVAIEDEFCLGIINNIQGAAKGMKMAPKAKLNDGLIDLILIKSHKTVDLMSIFTKIYDGTHTELDYVIYKQVKRFSITPFKSDKDRKKIMKKEKKKLSKHSDEIHSSESASHLEIFKKTSECGASNTILSTLKDDIDEEIIDIDGELKGTTPFVCEMLPRCIRVIV